MTDTRQEGQAASDGLTYDKHTIDVLVHRITGCDEAPDAIEDLEAAVQMLEGKTILDLLNEKHDAALSNLPVVPAGQAVGEPKAFDGYLCRAWGETDLPCAEVVQDLDGIKRFMVREWLGEEDHEADDGTNTLAQFVKDFEAHNWSNEDVFKYTFEIGGVSVERVYSFASSPTAAAVGQEPVAWEYRWFDNATQEWWAWERVEARSRLSTVEDRVREIQHYIATGTQYELRALYTSPQADALDALQDALSGWKYIRDMHGDLYGVGWDRVQQKLEATIAAMKGQTHDR